MPDKPRPKVRVVDGVEYAQIDMNNFRGELTPEAKAEVLRKLTIERGLGTEGADGGSDADPASRSDGHISLGEVGMDKLVGELTVDAKAEIVEKLIRQKKAAARAKPEPKKGEPG